MLIEPIPDKSQFGGFNYSNNNNKNYQGKFGNGPTNNITNKFGGAFNNNNAPAKPWQQQKMFSDINLEEQKDLIKLTDKCALFCGPAGTGKTTLARVIAKHCGYNPIEINASDERTQDSLLKRIKNITETTNVKESVNGPS